MRAIKCIICMLSYKSNANVVKNDDINKTFLNNICLCSKKSLTLHNEMGN